MQQDGCVSLGWEVFSLRTCFPHFPWRFTLRIHLIQSLFILERIHRSIETIIFISDELLLFDQSLEWLPNQFLSRSDIAEDLFLEDKESTIDPNIGLAYVLNFLNIVLSVQRDKVIAQIRLDTDKTSNFVLV